MVARSGRRARPAPAAAPTLLMPASPPPPFGLLSSCRPSLLPPPPLGHRRTSSQGRARRGGGGAFSLADAAGGGGCYYRGGSPSRHRGDTATPTTPASTTTTYSSQQTPPTSTALPDATVPLERPHAIILISSPARRCSSMHQLEVGCCMQYAHHARRRCCSGCWQRLEVFRSELLQLLEGRGKVVVEAPLVLGVRLDPQLEHVVLRSEERCHHSPSVFSR